jgi:F-type H+-transporting ATPase subunit delta
MKISKTAAATARRIFGLCQSDGRLDEDKLRTAAAHLGATRPRDFLAILSALHTLTRRDAERREVTVDSAVELSPTERQRVLANLEKQYGPDLSVRYRSEPSLLGGLRIRVGNDVYDGSVQGRLDRLARAF